VSTAAPDIAGQWSGDDWGQVVLKKTSDAEYTGTYSDTVSKQPGEIQLKWSRIERRFNGTWREGEDRFGELSVRLSGEEIRGALTTDPKSKVNPANLRSTCGQPHCHPNMPEKIANSKIHIGPDEKSSGALYTIQRILLILVLVLLGITVLWFVPGFIRKLRLLKKN